jgi:acyl dehydratase
MGIKVLDSENQTLGYDDYEIGDEFTTPMVTVTETHQVIFAGLTGDYSMGHTCEHFCNELSGDIGGGTRIVYGLLGMAMALGLFARMGVVGHLKQGAFLGIDRWRFKAPIKIGDSICSRVTVLEKKVLGKKPEWGSIRFGVTVTNHKGEIVQSGEQVIAISRRNKPD